MSHLTLKGLTISMRSFCSLAAVRNLSTFVVSARLHTCKLNDRIDLAVPGKKDYSHKIFHAPFCLRLTPETGIIPKFNYGKSASFSVPHNLNFETGQRQRKLYGANVKV